MAEYDIPDDCRYTQEDEWIRADGDQFLVGITDYAQQQLGDVVFVELPEVGTQLERNETFGVIESVKAVSDLYAPISGEVSAVNDPLSDSPESVNEDCYGDGWMIAIIPDDPKELDELMDAESYGRNLSDRKE